MVGGGCTKMGKINVLICLCADLLMRLFKKLMVITD
jgi:hypothetical protein